MATDLGYIAAFGGGVISFASPCVLPLVPAYLSVIAGVDVRGTTPGSQTTLTRMRVAKMTLTFIAGFGLVFVILGMTATAIGRSIFSNHILISRITGVSVVILGLFILGSSFSKSLLFAREIRFHPSFSKLGAFGPSVAGVAFGFGWTPCIGPILGSILVVAANQHTVAQGGLLLGAYTAGLGVPFMMTGLAFQKVSQSFNWLKRHSRTLTIASGIALVSFGVLLTFDKFSIITVAMNNFFTSIGLAKLIYLG